MIKSMTAYGRFSKETPFGRLVVEIHSVNRKMLDLSIYLPKDFLRFEIEVRKWVMAQLERGQVTVRISLQHDGAGERVYENTLRQLQMIKAAWDQIAIKLGRDPQKEVDLQFLVEQMQSFSPIEKEKDDAAIREALKDAVAGALQELMRMKELEGKVLAADMEARLNVVRSTLNSVEAKKEAPLARYQQKIRERLQEIGPMTSEVEDRVHREIALMAEKADVTEEIVRANSHIQQFQMHLKTAEKAIGRTLDFLVQEMNREANTLAAKSMETEISLAVVNIKSELEKIREQVQNIE
ncbi:MAG: YicC family protein [Parachlamydiales bacterium]|nr:YicC family protein [Verrucomicrobiota bacterium]MBX3719962.1 YicC family protein [Candidatus Acheromyda pituitae]